MPYSEFMMDTIQARLGVEIRTKVLFSNVAQSEPPVWLLQHLERIKGLSLNGEKVRGELLVSPVLLAVRELEDNRLAIFSGSRFDVDPAKGLVGECDFIVGLVESVVIVQAPIVTMVEAKKADIDLGVAQCIAQMTAAQTFNRNAGRGGPVFGCVTTGREWQFLKLNDALVEYDRDTRSLLELPLLLGIFRSMIAEGRAALAAHPSGSSKSV